MIKRLRPFIDSEYKQPLIKVVSSYSQYQLGLIKFVDSVTRFPVYSVNFNPRFIEGSVYTVNHSITERAGDVILALFVYVR